MNCRLCYGPIRTMLSLTPTPLANSFPATPDQDAERVPLDVAQCISCDHVQLAEYQAVDWVDYRYATPAAVRPHLEAAATVLRRTYPEAKTVLEIGCNNGLYLDVLRQAGFSAIGVDPCTEVGIKKPFGYGLAHTLEPVDLIVANNVLAHVDDLWDVFRGIDFLLKDDGALVFEVQYFPQMTATGAFDMIYHEHRDYHTLSPWPAFLKRWGLVITDIEPLPTHGGSIRLCCERPGIGMAIDPEPIDWKSFKYRIAEAKRGLLERVTEVNGPLVAFGATAKACTLIHHFGLADVIDYAVDNTPAKQGRYIPGTRIQIYPESRLDEVPPAAVLMTAWNFRDVLMSQYPQLHWVIPFEEGVCR